MGRLGRVIRLPQNEKRERDQKEKAAEEAAKKRRAQLATYADAVVRGARATPQRYSDVDALAMVANYAAALTTDRDQYIDDMGAVLAGVTRETLSEQVNPLSRNFGQTGFRPEFQEPQFGPDNNQVRHFMAWVVAGYELGKYPGGALAASVANAMREAMDRSGSGTWPDVLLGQAGVNLGYSIRLEVTPLRDVGHWIQLNISSATP